MGACRALQEAIQRRQGAPLLERGGERARERRRVVQRQVLYLDEINDSQRAAWCRSIEVVEGASRSKQVALFPEDREAPELECEVVQVRLAELTLHAPRQWGACWLALTLLGASGAGPVLGTALAGEPRRDPMGGYSEDSGLLPPYGGHRKVCSQNYSKGPKHLDSGFNASSLRFCKPLPGLFRAVWRLDRVTIRPR